MLLVIALHILRRRDEILQDFLMPDEREPEKEFLKREKIVKEEPADAVEEPTAPVEESGWGDVAPPPES